MLILNLIGDGLIGTIQNAVVIPRVGDSVKIKEGYYTVQNVVWHLIDGSSNQRVDVFIVLSERR